MKRLLPIFILMLTLAAPAVAHPVPFSYLDLQLGPGNLDAFLVIHIFDLAHDLDVSPMERLLQPDEVRSRLEAIRTLIAPRLELSADGHTVFPEWLQPEILEDRQSVRFHLRYPVASAPGRIEVHGILFPYDPNHQTFVNVYENDRLTSQVVLDAAHSRSEYFAGSRQGVLAVIEKFIPAGVHHILIGPDHLLFLVGLLLLDGTIRRLAAVVTSFTVAHSITLSLAALDVFRPPPQIIEPAIDLSIVYVGLDNLLKRGGRDVRAWIALAFGFIHGFGFASVLREMGLPARALGWSLFSFNFGVEIGQLIVVVLVASALAVVRSRSEMMGRRVAFAGSIVVVAAGAFWFIQRLFFPGWSF